MAPGAPAGGQRAGGTRRQEPILPEAAPEARDGSCPCPSQHR